MAKEVTRLHLHTLSTDTVPGLLDEYMSPAEWGVFFKDLLTAKQDVNKMALLVEIGMCCAFGLCCSFCFHSHIAEGVDQGRIEG